MNSSCTPGIESAGLGPVQLYLERRLQPYKNRTPLIISIGGSTYRGFILGLNFNASAGSSTPMITGSIMAKAWPT